MDKYKVVGINTVTNELELRRVNDNAFFTISGLDVSAYRIGDVLQYTPNGVRFPLRGFIQ